MPPSIDTLKFMSTSFLQHAALSLLITSATFHSASVIAEDKSNDENRFEALFDGKTLAGWRGDPNHWKVVNGAIIGTTKPAGRKTNTFLIADGDYEDFVQRLKFKLTNGASGIQFRSVPIGSPEDFLVTGYQADIGGGDTGTFYEEKGRGTLVPADQAVVKTGHRPNDWNTYTITMIGKTGEIKLNGQVTARYTESREQAPASGVIALQLEAGSGMEIAFKDIEIHELKPAKSKKKRTASKWIGRPFKAADTTFCRHKPKTGLAPLQLANPSPLCRNRGFVSLPNRFQMGARKFIQIE